MTQKIKNTKSAKVLSVFRAILKWGSYFYRNYTQSIRGFFKIFFVFNHSLSGGTGRNNRMGKTTFYVYLLGMSLFFKLFEFFFFIEHPFILFKTFFEKKKNWLNLVTMTHPFTRAAFTKVGKFPKNIFFNDFSNFIKTNLVLFGVQTCIILIVYDKCLKSKDPERSIYEAESIYFFIFEFCIL